MFATPASLLDRLRNPGEPTAWDRFVELYTPLLFHWARRLGLQSSDSADLVQDVFLILWRKLPEFEYDSRRSFHAWLKTIFLNRYRSRQRQRDPILVGAGGLDRAAEATRTAVEDTDVAGTAYPVQRLRDIQVSTPSRIVSQKTLPITLVPVWPSGADPINPLYKSPAVGDPSEMLTAVAGGEKGVRFSDACSGALSVSPDGLTVTALSQTPECSVNAQVGNFTSLASSPFAIVTRGG